MSRLSNPDAQRLLAELDSLLGLARSACNPQGKYSFPAQLSRLPEVIADLQPYLGRSREDPVPFWKCVRAVNKARPGKRIISVLTELFSRATQITAGPLTRLKANACTPPLTKKEQWAVARLARHLRAHPNRPVPNVGQYAKIFARVASSNQHRLLEKTPIGAIAAGERRIYGHLGFLDFYWQHRAWIDRYFEGVVSLYDLAVSLEHEPFLRRLKPLLFGTHFTVAGLAKAQARSKVMLRQRKHRKK
jgi:hypothetical protein